MQAIHDYIAKDLKVYAIRFVKSLIAASRKLEAMPQCGRIVPEFENSSIREVIYRIVYRILDIKEHIEILTVVHGARDMKAAFCEEWNFS